MTTEVRTPFSVSAVELSGGGLYRKQILAFDTIDYTDRSGKRRKITFDRDYGQKLVDAFRAGAYPQVPFQLADADNRHTNDVTRTGGEVVGLELSADGSGVDGILRCWGDGHRVVEMNPKLGVSARMLENVTRPDGRTFPVALQHVLGTVDPQMVGMRPWERVNSVDLANAEITEELDLSTVTYEGGARMAGRDGNETVVMELSVEQQERLGRILEDDEAVEALLEQLGDDWLEDSDDNEDEEEAEEVEETDDVELSGAYAEAIELANAQSARNETRILELTNQLAGQRVDNEAENYRRRDLAPAVIELARPLLAFETGAVELSNGLPGGEVDPGQIVRDILDTVIELANSGHLIVDSAETGSLQGNDAAKATREALLADWETYN